MHLFSFTIRSLIDCVYLTSSLELIGHSYDNKQSIEMLRNIRVYLLNHSFALKIFTNLKLACIILYSLLNFLLNNVIVGRKSLTVLKFINININ